MNVRTRTGGGIGPAKGGYRAGKKGAREGGNWRVREAAKGKKGEGSREEGGGEVHGEWA